MTEQEIIEDIKKNKIGKYSKKSLDDLLRCIVDVYNQIKIDQPLSQLIINYYDPKYRDSLKFDDCWKRVKNLEESIDIALNRKELWEKPYNPGLYTLLFSFKTKFKEALNTLTNNSRYKEAYKWLNEKEISYQSQLKERKERNSDKLKKRQWETKLQNNEKRSVPIFEKKTCTWDYPPYYIDQDGYYYNIDENGKVKKSNLTLSKVLSRYLNLK